MGPQILTKKTNIMTTEQKVDLILKKLEEKKPKDAWEKLQIVATILTGVFTLLLAYFNLTITTKISEQQQVFSQTVHRDEQLTKQREDKRQEMDEFIQELGLLPDLTTLLESKNVAVQNIAREVLQKLDSNENFKGHIIVALAKFPKDKEAPSENAILYKTSSSTANGEPFWVYLGQKEDGQWQTRFFNIQALPNPNSVITAIANVYKRNKKPTKIGDTDNWDLGRKIGVIKSNSTVTVLDTLGVEGDNYWALVK
jgi:hypothetical protein